MIASLANVPALPLRLPVSRPTFNRFVASLPHPDLDRLLVAARRQRVSAREVLFEAGEDADCVYFPERGTIVSMVQVFRNGEMVDAAIVGDEGACGLDAVLGAAHRTSRAMAQCAGAVWRVDASFMRDAMKGGGALQQRLFDFVHVYLVQLAQTAACNRVHDLQQRLARSLLFLRDRVSVEDMRFTHEILAEMVGSRRAGVTLALADLERRGLLDRGRRRIRIIDPATLEDTSCECYGRIAQGYRRMLA